MILTYVETQCLPRQGEESELQSPAAGNLKARGPWRGRPPGWAEVGVLWLVLPSLFLYSSLLKWYLRSPGGQQTYPTDIGEG